MLEIWFLDEFSMSVSSASKLESLLIIFAGSDSRRWQERLGGGGDNLREGDYLKEGYYFKYCLLEVVP